MHVKCAQLDFSLGHSSSLNPKPWGAPTMVIRRGWPWESAKTVGRTTRLRDAPDATATGCCVKTSWFCVKGVFTCCCFRCVLFVPVFFLIYMSSLVYRNVPIWPFAGQILNHAFVYAFNARVWFLCRKYVNSCAENMSMEGRIKSIIRNQAGFVDLNVKEAPGRRINSPAARIPRFPRLPRTNLTTLSRLRRERRSTSTPRGFSYLKIDWT